MSIQQKEKPTFYPRGSVLKVDLGYGESGGIRGNEPNGSRYCVVLSFDTFNVHSPNVVVAPFTKSSNKIHGKEVKVLGTQKLIEHKNYPFLYTDSIVLTESIRTVSKERVTNYCGYLDSNDMHDIENCMKLLLKL